MNAQQRRKAYRSIDRMVGKVFNHMKNNGDLISVTVLGLTQPVHLMASNSDWSTFDGARPSVHRIRCVRNKPDGSTFSPRLSTLRIA
jgi:hypothetical protein